MLSFGPFSTELCGGTHAGATGEIGLLKVVSETGIAAGVRRIEAVTGMGALRWVRERERLLEDAAGLLKAPPGELQERIERLLEERKQVQRRIESLEGAQRGEAASESSGKALVAVGVTKDLTGRYKAGDLVREVAKVVGGGGGGRPDFAQAGGKDPARIDEALEKFQSLVEANA